MLRLLPLALGSAVYPTLLAVVILILTQPNPRRLLAAYLAGAMLTSLTIGLVIVGGLSSGHVLNGSGGRAINPAVDLAIGLLLLALLYALLTGRDRRLIERRERRRAKRAEASKEPWSDRVLARQSIVLTFVVGMALNLPGALYLVALKEIAAADQSTAKDLFQLVTYNVIMFAWAEIPLIGYGVAPERTEALVKRIHDWLGSHTRQIAVGLCAAAAVYLTVRGAAGLLD
ncbi:MAG TPA: GAP family protein [Solirubrobacterales bacterium]|nr:GAP family protein [Solirubrobacterales bacterium]